MFYIIHVVTKVKLYLKSDDKNKTQITTKEYKYQIPSQIFGNLFFNITIICIRHFTDQFIL